MLKHDSSSATTRRLLLACVAGVSFMIMLDSNIVAVSLPAIAQSLHADFADVEWVVSAYILAFASSLMAAGSLADRYGRRRILLLGLTVFTLASLGCGMAATAPLLNAARALQGIGAALQLSSALAILGHEFRGAARARAFATWGAVMGGAAVSGPIVGGLVTAYWGWTWAFLVNVPIGVGLLWLAVVVVPESRDPAEQKLDYIGAALLASAIFALVWGVIDGAANGWSRGAVRYALAGGVLLACAFVIAERKQRSPMMDMGLFAVPTFIGSVIAMFGFAAAAQVMMTYLPLYLQVSFGMSAAEAGLRMLPFALPLLVVPRIAGIAAAKLSGRALLTLGLAVVSAGNALTALAASFLSYPMVAAAMVVVGCGAGMLNAETVKVLMGSVPSARTGMASGIGATVRFVGLLGGIAGLGAVLSARLQIGLVSAFDRFAGLAPSHMRMFIQRVSAGDMPGALASIPVEFHERATVLARVEFARAFATTLMIASAIAAAAAVLTWILVGDRDTAPAGAHVVAAPAASE